MEVRPATYSTVGTTLAKNALQQSHTMTERGHFQDARSALTQTGDTLVSSPDTTETEKILGKMCRAVSETTMSSVTAAHMNAAVMRVVSEQVAGSMQNALTHAALNVVNCGGGTYEALVFGSRAAAAIAAENCSQVSC